MLKVKLLTEFAQAPTRGSEGAAGYDLYSGEVQTLSPGERKLVKTFVAVAVPPGTYGRVAPRSGLALKCGIAVLAGVIDEDYRGNVGVIMHNTSDRVVFVKMGDRIAQLILEKIETPEVVVVEHLDESVRGDGAFGSTGK